MWASLPTLKLQKPTWVFRLGWRYTLTKRLSRSLSTVDSLSWFRLLFRAICFGQSVSKVNNTFASDRKVSQGQQHVQKRGLEAYQCRGCRDEKVQWFRWCMVCFSTERDAVTAVFLLRRRMHVLASELFFLCPKPRFLHWFLHLS